MRGDPPRVILRISFEMSTLGMSGARKSFDFIERNFTQFRITVLLLWGKNLYNTRYTNHPFSLTRIAIAFLRCLQSPQFTVQAYMRFFL